MLSRTLAVLGLLAMLTGGLDPLEGSVIILPGVGIATLGAFLGRSRHTRLLCWSLAMVTVGVAAMFVLSAFGGIGGPSGHSNWWGAFILPYPAGFLLALVTATRRIVEAFRRHDAPQPA
jgi:hypothetical protein